MYALMGDRGLHGNWWGRYQGSIVLNGNTNGLALDPVRM